MGEFVIQPNLRIMKCSVIESELGKTRDWKREGESDNGGGGGNWGEGEREREEWK